MLKKLFSGSTILLSSIAAASMNAPSFCAGPSLFLKASTATSSNSREASPRLSLGYGGTAGQGVYIAGEVFLAPGSMQINSRNIPGTPALKTTFSYGLSAIPGLMISQGTMVFVHIGVVETHFSNQSKTIAGLQTGVGIQTQISASWDLRGEYIYNAYRSLTGVGSPRSDWFGLGGVYNF